MEDSRTSTLEATVRAAGRAHRDLEACIAGLAAVANGECEGNALRAPVDVLRRALEEHFRHEESSPLYQWLPTAFPEEQHRLDSLRAQHGPLLDAVAGLANFPDGELRVRAQEVVEHLRRHEAAEDGVLDRLTQALRTASQGT